LISQADPVDQPGVGHLVIRLGPAFVAAIAYVDPGNVATNVSAGSQYAYQLVWVVLLANLLAVLTQYLSAKLGLATGRTLPELCRERFPRPVVYLLWGQAEVVAIATDVAEVIGGAVALYLLFGVPLLAGGFLTGTVAFVLLIVQTRRGQRSFERLTAAMLALIFIGFGYAAVTAEPSPGGLAGGLIPDLPDRGSILLAAAILGATIMPHAIYLHSALIRDRFGVVRTVPARRRLLTATRIDVVAAMLVAGATNVMLIAIAAGSLAGSGVTELEQAYHLFDERSGALAAACFGLALLVSGLVSSSVGTYAGSVILAGFLRRSIPVTVRRLVTIVPALGILALGLEPTRALVLSQVTLSIGIPFALWPLVFFTRDASLMGELVNRRITTLAASCAAVFISVLAVLTILVGG
jgi:manganese transport protein